MRSHEARFLNSLAAAADKMGEWVEMLALTQQSVLINREIGERVGEATNLSNLGLARLALGDLAQAQGDLDAALKLTRANGDRGSEEKALVNQSHLALWLGDETRALALARAALELAVMARARESEVIAEIHLGHAELSLSRMVQAREAYARARTLAEHINVPQRLDASAGLARVALTEGLIAEALAAIQPVLDQIGAGGSLEGTEALLIELTCHNVLAVAGDPRARDWLSRAYSAMMARASTIEDVGLRKGFLENIPHHREITRFWAEYSTAAQSHSRPSG
jgi:tetratricopeptide (TPR) repeat protein